MDTGRVLLIVCLTLFIVIGLNAAIYVALTRKKGTGLTSQIELLQRASQRARDPWKIEDEAWQELSRRVENLKEEHKEHE